MRRVPRSARLAGAAVLLALVAGPAVAAPGAAAPAGAASGTVTASGTASGTASAATLPTASTDAGTVVLTGVSPAVVTRGTGVTVTGTLTAGSVPLSNPTISLVRGTSRLDTRAEVSTWAQGTDPAGGTTYGDVQPAPALAAGQQVGFTLTVPAGRVRDASPWGVLPVSVQVTSTQGASAVHTFLGWWARKEYQPLQVGVVAPVTLPPSTDLWAQDPITRAAAWNDAVGSGSALDHLLSGTDGTGVPVAWAVDPAALGVDASAGGSSGRSSTGTSTGTSTGASTGSATPSGTATGSSTPSGSTTSTGSPTSSPTGSPTSGATGGRSASEELADARIARTQDALAARLRSAAGSHPLWSLPPADPDLAAYATRGDPTVQAQVRDTTGLATRLSLPTGQVTTGVAWPADGGLTPDTERGLRSAYGAALQGALVSSSTLVAETGYAPSSPHRSPGGLPVLAWDDTLSTLASRTTGVPQGVLATQEVVAQTAVLLGQSPGISRSFLIALPRGLDPAPDVLRGLLTTLATTPWVQVGDPGSLLQGARTETPVSALSATTWSAGGDPPAPGLLGEARRARGAVDTVASLLPDRSADRDRWRSALDQLTSTRWRGRGSAAAALVGAARSWATASTSNITVVSQDTNFLAEEGILQVTVVNGLSDPVSGLYVRLAPGDPRLRIVEQPAAVTVGARSRTTINVRVQALAAGLVPVTVDLRTADGSAVGTPAQLNVRANPPGRAFYLVSGAVLALILLVGVVRQARAWRRRKQDVASP